MLAILSYALSELSQHTAVCGQAHAAFRNPRNSIYALEALDNGVVAITATPLPTQA